MTKKTEAARRTDEPGAEVRDGRRADGAGEAADVRPEGRRERKKRETRLRISDLATGLMMERGFDAVTMAEVAEAADVSVNTVYNYFPTKEDLFFDREKEMVDRPARLVRERAPGESAADVLLGTLRADISARNLHSGMMEGYAEFMSVVRATPSLMARLMLMEQRSVFRLAETLREETRADPADPDPELVASQLVNLTNTVFRWATRGLASGRDVESVVAEAEARVDAGAALASDKLLNYARRPAT